jgi:hypothetical protein
MVATAMPLEQWGDLEGLFIKIKERRYVVELNI